MTFTITIFYAGILAILIALLGTYTMVQRARLNISWGHEDNFTMQKAIRSHANISEYAPIFIILLAFLETNNSPDIWLNALGSVFIFGRFASAAYFLIKQSFALRVIAFWCTNLPILIGGVFLLTSY